ncbi:aminoacyl-tRNA hydrolase [Acetobacter orientalis]|uniref:Translation peptide chain release factor Class I/peptidyl-tRNA hydrolase n=2 Tax=Acetobacter orientalis TaxID=146474 RepID=A0A0D6NJU1_9PROT|nr:translation peptide chain release factor Class I/peptidyl-tRNA hydrolase [Acetobacter orientalis]GEL60458.1 aminoacyl-tRNA hydrolase [Acetobacter orientalis]
MAETCYAQCMAIQILPTLSLAETELEVSYILASGPGGQNVNKVATAAQLRFNAAASPALSERIKQRLLEIAGSRATRDGVIVITARRFRTQLRNREDAIERLADLIREAAHRPAYRVATRPSRAAKRRRLDGKAHRATLKRQRTVRFDD